MMEGEEIVMVDLWKPVPTKDRLQRPKGSYNEKEVL